MSAVMTETETCSLQGATQASCSADIIISGTAKVTTTSTTSVLSGSTVAQYYMYQLPVTAGAQNLQATGGVCSGTTKTTIPLLLGGVLGVVVFLAAVVL